LFTKLAAVKRVRTADNVVYLSDYLPPEKQLRTRPRRVEEIRSAVMAIVAAEAEPGPGTMPDLDAPGWVADLVRDLAREAAARPGREGELFMILYQCLAQGDPGALGPDGDWDCKKNYELWDQFVAEAAARLWEQEATAPCK